MILQADHDLNNLINQFYVPRLIAEKGQFGMGKGMDGHAGKDLIVKVPCGTLVWKLPNPVEPVASEEEPAAEPIEIKTKSAPRQPALIATPKRPLLRWAGSAMAEEVDLSAEEGASSHEADEKSWLTTLFTSPI